MILINPPVTRPSEPQPGIARLAGALGSENIPHTIVDANLEGLLFLLGTELHSTDTWTRRATKSVASNISSLRSWDTYSHTDKYRAAISNINRVLFEASKKENQFVSLSDYSHAALSPLQSRDLAEAFEHPEKNVFYPYFSDRITRLFESEGFEIAGFSLSFLTQAICTFAIAGFIRRCLPRVTLVLGGSLVTSWSKNARFFEVCEGRFDHVIKGRGEDALTAICRKGGGTLIEAVRQPTPYTVTHMGSTGDYDATIGVVGQPGPGRGKASINAKPSFDGFRLKEYIAPAPVIPYNASTGCYWKKCTFCPENAEENDYIPNSPSKVLDDLDTLKKALSPGLVHFTDSALPPALLHALVARPPGTHWYGFSRIEKPLADPDFAFGLAASGCIMLSLGVESGNDRVLQSANKGSDTGLTSAVLKNLKRANISTYVYLLFGTPEEDREAAIDTVDFVASHAEYIDFLNISIFNMPVQSAIAERHERSIFYEGDLSLYTDFTHKAGWDRKAVRRFLDFQLKPNRAIAPILRKKPPSFSSNHAAFFVIAQNKKLHKPSVSPA